MRKKTFALVAVCALVVVIAAVAAAVKLGPAGSTSSAAAGPAAGSLAREALAYQYSGRESFGIPVPVAREKGARGREASREIVNGFAQQAYADLAFPHKTVAVAQLQGALAAMRQHNNDADDDGRQSRSSLGGGRALHARRRPRGDPEQRPPDPVVRSPDGDGRRPQVRLAPVPALRRRGGRRGLAHGQRAQPQPELEVARPGAGHDLDRRAPDRPDRQVRPHDLRRHR